MKRSLLKSIFLATLIAVGLGSILLASSFGLKTTSLVEGLLGAAAVVIPVGAAAWWLFKRCLEHAPRLEALVVAIVFGVSAPIATIMIIPFAQIAGGHLADIGRVFGLIGSVATLIVGVTLLCFVAASLARWVVRRFSVSSRWNSGNVNSGPPL